jgi:hypothetical protein
MRFTARARGRRRRKFVAFAVLACARALEGARAQEERRWVRENCEASRVYRQLAGF